jgi:hypothetical protein
VGTSPAALIGPGPQSRDVCLDSALTLDFHLCLCRIVGMVGHVKTILLRKGSQGQASVLNRYSRNSTIPVSRLYIEPAIFMLPLELLLSRR